VLRWFLDNTRLSQLRRDNAIGKSTAYSYLHEGIDVLTPGVDLWWSGKHHHHGGNIQVISAPDGHPIWTSPVRPGREYDTTAARAHPSLLPALAAAKADGLPTLPDLGYEGEADTVHIPVKTPAGDALTTDQKTYTACMPRSAPKPNAPTPNSRCGTKHYAG
jgi:hypothetical protein